MLPNIKNNHIQCVKLGLSISQFFYYWREGGGVPYLFYRLKTSDWSSKNLRGKIHWNGNETGLHNQQNTKSSGINGSNEYYTLLSNKTSIPALNQTLTPPPPPHLLKSMKLISIKTTWYLNKIRTFYIVWHENESRTIGVQAVKTCTSINFAHSKQYFNFGYIYMYCMRMCTAVASSLSVIVLRN